VSLWSSWSLTFLFCLWPHWGGDSLPSLSFCLVLYDMVCCNFCKSKV
jgi:hypothetical protein